MHPDRLSLPDVVTTMLFNSGMPFWAARILTFFSGFPSIDIAARNMGGDVAVYTAQLLNGIADRLGHDPYVTAQTISRLAIIEEPMFGDGGEQYPGFDTYAATGRAVILIILGLLAKYVKGMTKSIVDKILSAWITDIILENRLRPISELQDEMNFAISQLEAVEDFDADDVIDSERMLNDANLHRLVQLLSLSLANNTTIYRTELDRYMDNNLTGQNVQRR